MSEGHVHGDRGTHNHGRSHLETRTALLIAISVTGTVMIVEAVGGFMANSLALISDAGHMFTDVLALGLSLVALQFSLRPPSPTKTYGFYRMEILAAFVNGTSLIVITGLIVYEAYHRLRQVEQVATSTMLVVATIGLVANGIAALAMMKRSGESLNVRGAYLHIVGDALSSLGVILAGGIIHLTGWHVVDPLISLVICGVILRGAFVLVKDSVNILLEAVPKDLDLGEIQQALLGVPGVRELHDVHLWTISSGIHAMSAHVLVDDLLTSRTGEILHQVTQVLRERYRIEHTTIQFECENCEEGMYCQVDRGCVAVSRIHGHTH